MSPAGLQKRWLTDQLSNFDYLLRLNMIAGRSFRDRSIYPIFPSILNDFDDIDSMKTKLDKFKLTDGKGEIKVDFENGKGIRESFNEFDFVRADYYFRPESIDYVPKSWAKDEFDVVYKLRKLLDSSDITCTLHKWINNVFKKFNSRFSNLQTFRSDHLQHPSSASSLSAKKSRALTMIKIIDIGSTAPSGKIIAASALSDNIFLALSTSGVAYYIVLNRPEMQSSSLLLDSQNSMFNQHEDNDINYSSLLLSAPQTPPSSPSTMNSASQNANSSSTSSSISQSQSVGASISFASSANSIVANVVSTFKAQTLSFGDEELNSNGSNNSNSNNNSMNSMNNINNANVNGGNGGGISSNSILNLNSVSSLSDDVTGVVYGVNRKSVGSDSGAFESDLVIIKRSNSTHINSVASFGSFDSFGSGLSSFNSFGSFIGMNQECFSSNVSFGFTRGKIAWYKPDENKVHLIGDERVINEANIFPELPFIGCCDEETFFCSDPCTVSVIKPGQNPYPICTTSSRISALVADEIFHVIVIGTRDGFIHIYRSIDGGLVKSIDLSIDGDVGDYESSYKEVRKILITSRWGLIVVRIFNKIKIFNINGRHIIDIELKETILKWFTYSNDKSFDFVVFENSEHKIGFFDPLKADSVKYFYETMEPLPLISFIPSINCFAFLAESKQITLVPHP